MVTLNREDYRKKVLGCWMGKNIGGTLGAPFEWRRQVNAVSFYTQDLGGEPLPNDDLDIQSSGWWRWRRWASASTRTRWPTTGAST